MIHDELITLLDYDPANGVSTWIVSRNTDKKGKVAGTLTRKGYIRIKLAGKCYLAHRLAWFFMTGEWPKGEINHINGVKTDNRFCNLEDGSKRNNMSNLKCHREGHLLGTSFCKRSNKWRSRIKIQGKEKHLGLYDTDIEAHEVYKKALAELNEEK